MKKRQCVHFSKFTMVGAKNISHTKVKKKRGTRKKKKKKKKNVPDFSLSLFLFMEDIMLGRRSADSWGMSGKGSAHFASIACGSSS